jgi:putative protease
MEYSLVKCKGKGRMNVKSGYLLSPKDISTATMIDELVESGVDSLKIEGRMKAPEYVARVVSFYRKYVDAACIGGDNKVSSEDIRELTQIFNRGGSSYTGYYHTYAGTDMMSSSPKSSGVRIGTVAEYDKSRRVCTINLTAEVTGGDGIEVWTQKGPHTGTNISHKAAAGSTIRLHLDGNVQKGDAVFLSYDKRLNDKLKTTYARASRQRKVYVDFKAVQGEEMCISVPEFGVEVKGSVVQAAQNQPTDSERIITQLKKTGGTPFEFCLNACDIGENIYISISELNELRRKACKELEEKITACYLREKKFVRTDKYTPKKSDKPKISVLVSTAEQFKAALDSKPDRIYYVPENAKDLQKATSAAHKNGIELFAALPYISRDCNADNTKFIEECEKTSVNGFMIRSYMDITSEKRKVCDYTLNIMNSIGIQAAENIFGAESVTLSPELNLKELKALAGEDTEVVIYGRLPLMTTQQCPIGLYCGEKKNGKFCSEKGKNDTYILRDRKNAEFPIKPQCNACYAMIYNSAPVYIPGKTNDIMSIGAGMVRLEFTIEDYEHTKRVIEEHKRVICEGEQPSYTPDKEVTKGHFYRGVN